MERLRRNILAGLLTVIPLWITVWIIWFILNYITYLGRPVVFALARGIRPYADDAADLLTGSFVHTVQMSGFYSDGNGLYLPATRCEKTASSFTGILHLAAALDWIKS